MERDVSEVDRHGGSLDLFQDTIYYSHITPRSWQTKSHGGLIFPVACDVSPGYG